MKMKKVKKIITAFMAAALAIGLCQTPVFAAEDFPLADMNKTVTPNDAGFYKYNGWVTFDGAPSDAKYLEFDYEGDLTTLRIEFEKVPNSGNVVGPYWFDPANEGSKFVNADGGDFVLTGGHVKVDLAATGINVAEYIETKGGMHLHYGGGDEPVAAGTQVTISNAKLTGGAAASGDNNAASGDNNAASGDNKNTSTDPKKDTSKGAAKTGSTAVPTAVAGLVILGAGAVLVYSNKKKTA